MMKEAHQTPFHECLLFMQVILPCITICINTICNSIIEQSVKHILILHVGVHKEQHIC